MKIIIWIKNTAYIFFPQALFKMDSHYTCFSVQRCFPAIISFYIHSICYFIFIILNNSNPGIFVVDICDMFIHEREHCHKANYGCCYGKQDCFYLSFLKKLSETLQIICFMAAFFCLCRDFHIIFKVCLCLMVYLLTDFAVLQVFFYKFFCVITYHIINV